MHTTDFENEYAVLTLAALGLEHVPMLSTVDNVNGLYVFCIFFYIVTVFF